MNTLAVIPTFIREERHLNLARNTVKTLKASSDCDIFVIDDGSPLEKESRELLIEFNEMGCKTYWKGENEGFSRTVNHGLRQARDRGMNAVLVNADIEFIQKGWVERWEAREEAVCGALLLYPNTLIQHAGIYYSVIRREFDHIYRMAPGDLELAHQERICPVTAALQFIRHDTLKEIGLYDESFRLGYEDVDYCQRVFVSGRQCVYDPHVIAVHHEGQIRSRKADDKIKAWSKHSWEYLHEKWVGHDFSEYIPTLITELDDQ